MKEYIIISVLVFVSSIYSFAQNFDLQEIRKRAYDGDAKAMIELAQYYKEQGNTVLANNWLNKASQTEPELVREIYKADNIEEELNRADANRNFDKKLETYLKYIDDNNVHAMVGVANMYDTGQSLGVDADEAMKWYRKAIAIDDVNSFKYIKIEGAASHKILKEYADKGNAVAKAKYDEIQAQIVAEQKARKEEQDRIARENAEYSRNYNETMRNFAGLWKSRATRIQLKFDSRGNGWYRGGEGRTWETLGVKYISYNRIRIYDARDVYYLDVSGNTLTMGSVVFYRK